MDSFFKIEYSSFMLLKVVERDTFPSKFSFNLTLELKIFSNLLVASIYIFDTSELVLETL